MNPYDDEIEFAQHAMDPDDQLMTAADRALYSILSDRERYAIVEWAMRHKIEPNDPSWHLIELTSLTNRWTQETLEDMRAHSDQLLNMFSMEGERKQREFQLESLRMTTENQRLAAAHRRDFADAVERIVAPLNQQVVSAVHVTVRTTMAQLWRKTLPWVAIGTVCFALTFAGVGFSASRYLSPAPEAMLSSSQREALSIGEHVINTYQVMDANSRSQINQLFGWDAKRKDTRN